MFNNKAGARFALSGENNLEIATICMSILCYTFREKHPEIEAISISKLTWK